MNCTRFINSPLKQFAYNSSHLFHKRLQKQDPVNPTKKISSVMTYFIPDSIY